jgi:hypothetical protein
MRWKARRALDAQHGQLTETQLIADALRVLVCFGFCHHHRLRER